MKAIKLRNSIKALEDLQKTEKAIIRHRIEYPENYRKNRDRCTYNPCEGTDCLQSDCAYRRETLSENYKWYYIVKHELFREPDRMLKYLGWEDPEKKDANIKYCYKQLRKYLKEDLEANPELKCYGEKTVRLYIGQD
jgi:hypothetical protein